MIEDVLIRGDRAPRSELSEKDCRHHVHPITNPVWLQQRGAEIVVRAEGIYLYLEDGRRVIDAGAGLANVSLGYGNSRLCRTAFETMQRLSFCHSLFGRSNPWTAALAAKLAEITPPQFQHFFFASSGSEAVESAIKMALRYWRLQGRPSKRAVISRHMSYHGGTLFASSLTGMDLFRTQFGLSVGDRVHLADSTSWHSSGQGGSMEEFCQHLIRSLDAQILRIGPENIAAFVGDPIQTAGVIIPPDNYWQEVRRICDLYDILIVADEAITGFGKTGRMFGFENFNYEPDLIVMAKGISSGYFPISAVALGGRVANVLQNSDEILAHSFTNSGHPVGAAVALESIAIIEEDGLLRRVREEVGPYFAERLGELRRYPCIGDVRSIGILGGFSIDLSKVEVAAAADGNFYERVLSIAWRHGLAIRGTGSICLPMIVTKKQIDEIIDILKASIDEASLRCAAERPA